MGEEDLVRRGRPQTVSKDILLNYVWGGGEVGSRVKMKVKGTVSTFGKTGFSLGVTPIAS